MVKAAWVGTSLAAVNPPSTRCKHSVPDANTNTNTNTNTNRNTRTEYSLLGHAVTFCCWGVKSDIVGKILWVSVDVHVLKIFLSTLLKVRLYFRLHSQTGWNLKTSVRNTRLTIRNPPESQHPNKSALHNRPSAIPMCHSTLYKYAGLRDMLEKDMLALLKEETEKA